MLAHNRHPRGNRARFDLDGRLFEGVMPGGLDLLIPDLFPTCSLCESIQVGDFLDSMEKTGTHYRVMPWALSPLAFVVEIPVEPYQIPFAEKIPGTELTQVQWSESCFTWHIFRTEHLMDSSERDLARWREVVAPQTGIIMERDPLTGKLCWVAGYRSFVTWGTVGKGPADNAPAIEDKFKELARRGIK